MVEADKPSESEPFSPLSTMVKLTPELLAQASAGLNPIKERQLDLRGEQTHRLPRIAHTTF